MQMIEDLTNEQLVAEIKQGINREYNLEKLYLNNKLFIRKMASRYIAYAELDDLVQEGSIGLFEAIENYNENLGFKFLTYAEFHIKKRMTRYIGNNGKTIRIPIHLISQMQQYKKINNYFIFELGRKPTDEELTRALKIDIEQLKKLKSNIAKYKQIESLDKPIKSIEDDSMTIADTISNNEDLESSIVGDMMQEKAKNELWEIVSRECSPTQYEVINCRYRKDYTLKDTGEIIGVAPERARVVEANALRKLRVPRVSRELQRKFEINEARAYSGGVNSFNRTRTSSTERVALKNIELEEEWQEFVKKMETEIASQGKGPL